ncbi:hypothetical protein AB1Y20_020830 [Prymnesium parvum]|uniref:Peptide deformylase n=1 Tax=Prymnesium parvum TaxID=97485 RepID=A0AB34JZ82_PRYPA
MLRLAGDPILSKVSRQLSPGEALPRALLREMRHALLHERGSAVSAVQLGFPLRAVLVGHTTRPASPPRLLLNPRVLARSSRREADWETCLSVPGLAALVWRPLQLVAAYETSSGRTAERSLRGFAARMLEHEIDHLDGVLFTEKAIPGSLLPVEQLHSAAIRDSVRERLLRDVPHASLVPESQRSAWDSADDAQGFPI